MNTLYATKKQAHSRDERRQMLSETLQPNGVSNGKQDFIGQWKLSQAGHIILASTILGVVYPIFGDGLGSIIPFINGFIIGLLGGITISVIELFLFPVVNQRFSLLSFVLAKSFTYTFIISAFVFSVILVSRSLQYHEPIAEMYQSDRFKHFLLKEDFVIIVAYALLFAVVVIFTREMNIKLGHGAIWNFATGQYKHPRLERRIFMFIDLDASVSKAESLGDLGFHRLLNDFFSDLTNPILMSRGTIYQYVGDQVVVTWPIVEGKNADDCLKAYLCCHQKIKSAQERYLRKFGIYPCFKTAVHAGEVICGEIGSVKSAIVYHGDVVNTTARLERMCSDLSEDLLLSKEVFAMLSENVKNCFEKTAPLALKGKSKSLDVYQIKKSASSSEPAKLTPAYYAYCA